MSQSLNVTPKHWRGGHVLEKSNSTYTSCLAVWLVDYSAHELVPLGLETQDDPPTSFLAGYQALGFIAAHSQVCLWMCHADILFTYCLISRTRAQSTCASTFGGVNSLLVDVDWFPLHCV